MGNSSLNSQSTWKVKPRTVSSVPPKRRSQRETAPPSDVTDAKGVPRRCRETTRANASKPMGDHNVFTCCPKDPNSEACRMTKTTCARWKNRTLTLWDLITHLIWRPDNSGPHQEMISGTLLSCKLDICIGQIVLLRNKDMQQTQHLSCGDSCLHSKSQKESTQTIQGCLSKRGRTCNGLTMRTLFIVRKPTGWQKSCSTI